MNCFRNTIFKEICKFFKTKEILKFLNGNIIINIYIFVWQWIDRLSSLVSVYILNIFCILGKNSKYVCSLHSLQIVEKLHKNLFILC